MHEDRLVEAFNLMWQERKSLENGSISDVQELIRSELRDEFTHPRVRRTPQDKYRIAKARIEKLQIEEEIKHELIRFYRLELDAITRDVNPN